MARLSTHTSEVQTQKATEMSNIALRIEAHWGIPLKELLEELQDDEYREDNFSKYSARALLDFAVRCDLSQGRALLQEAMEKRINNPDRQVSITQKRRLTPKDIRVATTFLQPSQQTCAYADESYEDQEILKTPKRTRVSLSRPAKRRRRVLSDDEGYDEEHEDGERTVDAGSQQGDLNKENDETRVDDSWTENKNIKVSICFNDKL